VVSQVSFNAWGKRRNKNWSNTSNNEWESIVNSLAQESLYIGFTGHEMDDEVGLINMKGRLYDADIGRFISADPHVQAATDTQSFNRYTYVKNNPLSYTDPSSYFFKSLFRSIGKFVKKWGRTIAAIGLTFITGGVFGGLYSATIGGIAGGFVGGLVGTGSIKGALFGALSGGLAGSIGHGYLNKALRLGSRGARLAIAHGIAQGTVSVLRGAKFGAGFVSAYLGKLSAPYLGGANKYIRTAQAAVIGGTVSKIIGGKFGNGAVSAAFVHLFNFEGGRDDGNYRRCSSTSGMPCIDTGGYVDKRAYPGSGMAGWKEAGLSGYTRGNDISVGLSGDLSLIGPTFGGTIGINGQAGGGNNGLYRYYPGQADSQGFMFGGSIEINIAFGRGPWSGSFHNLSGSAGLSGSVFTSPSGSWRGISFGFGGGPPGASYSETVYDPWIGGR